MEPKYNLSLLRQIIKDKGHISIAALMENVVDNYYKSEDSIGFEGDFVTSPEISQLFGEMIGLWVAINWQNMGKPKKLDLIELGPGKGTLMNDILRGTKNVQGLHEALSIHCIEKSSKLQSIQQKKLSPWQNIKFTWHEDLSNLGNNPCVFIANEFFDALPINQYTKLKQYWYENIVTTLTFDGEFCFSNILAPLNVDDMLNYEHPNAEHRAIIEMSPVSINVIKQLAQHINKNTGYGLVIDYGYEINPANRVQYNSSLQAVKNHKYHPILKDIGQADITAHVDFFALKQALLDSSCNVYGTVSQSHFLANLGINMRLELLLKNASPSEKQNLISGVERLTSYSNMGSLFKVLSFSSDSLSKNIGFD